MRKHLRSPIAIAAAAAIVAPSAVADPVVLTPPSEQSEPAPEVRADNSGPSASAAIPPVQPLVADADPAGPLPFNLRVEAPPPPAPPPPPPPQPQPAAAPATPVLPPPPPPPPPPPRIAPAPTATVTVGVQEDYTRLAFRFEGPTSVTPSAQDNRLELRFSRAADLDMAQLRTSPPRFLREARRLSGPGQQVRVALVLDPGVRHRTFTDGDRVMVDLLPPERRADGAAVLAPITGAASVQLVEEANRTRVTVTWPSPARAAAFRRGEAVWLVFDATGQINLTGVARAGRRHHDIEIVRGEGVVGLRIPAPPDVLVSAEARDNAWTFTLGERADAGAAAEVRREVTGGLGRLVADFERDGVVRWLADPEIGDRIAVAMIGGPSRGVDVRRATMEAALLPSAHGGAIEPRADGVQAAFDHGALVITRGEGLIAAGQDAAAESAEARINAALLEAALEHGGNVEAPAPADGLSLVEVRERIDALTRAAAAEGVQEGAPVIARMALARFLLQQEFAPEALGALRMASINQGELVELNPEYRLMRGAANVMMGRVAAADADLNSSPLRDDPSAALWRGYAAALKQDWSEARRELERGAGALEQHPPGWRARFQLALAQAALELNDVAAAEAAMRAAMGQAGDQPLRLHARLLEARIIAARGDGEAALVIFDELSRIRDEEVAVRATLEGLRLRRASGAMRAIDATEPLEALRYRWRGDATELAIAGALGEAYSELGRWREALTAMRMVADRFPAEPAARRLRQDMATLFERLFLDGEADQLEPIQALGLFYEFADLTPVGPNGDRIVRLLAGRLVHVDLLEQAASLLQHQVDNRLEGMGRAQVAADLAAIYLMDSAPDRALVTLNQTRQANIPALLLAERRMLEARALLSMGRLEHAVELVERDRSADAQRVRAEAAWRARDWTRAAGELRGLLNMRDRAIPLDAGDRQAVLRAGIALTLAGDEAGVRTLYREFAGDLAGTDEADAFEIVASGIHAEGAAIRDLARIVARTDLLDRFMIRIRTRMTAEAADAAAQGGPEEAPAPPAPAPAPPAAPPAAAPARPTPGAQS